MSIVFLSGPIGAGKTAVAKALLPLLPAPLCYIEGDTFWSCIKKNGERGLPDNFPVLVRSMTAAAVPFARSGFRIVIDFSIPPTFVDTARKILKEVPFDFVLLRPSFEVCAKRDATRRDKRAQLPITRDQRTFTPASKRGRSNRSATTMLIRNPWPGKSPTA